MAEPRQGLASAQAVTTRPLKTLEPELSMTLIIAAVPEAPRM